MSLDNNSSPNRNEAGFTSSHYTLAASTGDVYCGGIANTNSRETLTDDPRRDAVLELPNPRPRRMKWDNSNESNCFRSAQWTADGRYIITNSEDSGVRVFALPSEWGQEKGIPQLKPYSVLHEPESVYCIGACPWVLEDPSLNWFITCTRDNPLHLYTLTGSILSTYILQHAGTEKYLAPHSLIFSRQDSHFICGTESMISVFDLNRREPLYNLRTIPSRKHTYSTQTMKGIVSTMGISPDQGILAAGTFSSSVGLYDQEGSGDVIAIFSLAEKHENVFSQKGVTDIRWSHCGTYIYIAERKDDKISMWDVRKLFGKVANLTGRDANTVQRLGIDSYLGEGGREVVVGGGLDGKVELWDVHMDTNPINKWQAHNDPVTSVAVNPAWPGLIATCSGQRHHGRRDIDDKEGSLSSIDNSLKLWRYSGHLEDRYSKSPEDAENEVRNRVETE